VFVVRSGLDVRAEMHSTFVGTPR